MNKPCCSIYKRGLGEEFRDSKLKDLEEKISQGIDKYVFAQLYDFLDEMLNYCPACGEALNEKVPSKNHDTDVTRTQKTVEAPQTPPPIKYCVACSGTGRAGGNPKSSVLCISCHGKGRRDGTNTTVKPDPDKVAQTEDLKEQIRQQKIDPKHGKKATEMDV